MLEQQCREEYVRRIHKVQDYIDSHLSEQMTVEILSEAAGFSMYHFSRIFQGVLHESLAHYVNRIKMEQALFLLAHRSDLNMTDITGELGFTDSAIFSRTFKNYYGISPREYRQEYSKNCKDSFRLSDYNKGTAAEERNLVLYADVSLKTFKEQNVVYVRHTGTYESLGKEYPVLINTLFEHAAAQHLLDNSDYMVLAIYHDNPEFGETSQFRTSLCLSISERIKVREDGILGAMKLEGGLFAVGHFRIRAEEYGDAWDYMYREWLTRSGYVPRNAYPFEVYLNNPQEDPEHMNEVEIWVPIEPLSC